MSYIVFQLSYVQKKTILNSEDLWELFTAAVGGGDTGLRMGRGKGGGGGREREERNLHRCIHVTPLPLMFGSIV